MFPIYLVVGLVNVFANYNNYGIHIDDPNMDIRVRRDLRNTDNSFMINLLQRHHEELLKDLRQSKEYVENKGKLVANKKHNEEFESNKLKSRELVRNKRQFSFFLPKKNQVTTTPKYKNTRSNYNGRLDYNFVTQNNGMLRQNKLANNVPANSYSNTWITRQNNNTNNGIYVWNNVTKRYDYRPSNGSNSWTPPNIATTYNNTNNGIYIRNNVTGFYELHPYNVTANNYSVPLMPYPSKVTLMPKFNTTGFWRVNFTGYTPQQPNYNPNLQPIFNYQDPTKSNFSGYFEQNFTLPVNNTPGYNWMSNYNVTVKPYAPGYLPIPEYKPTNTSTHWYNNYNNTPAPYQPGYGQITPGYVPGTSQNGTIAPGGNVTTSTEIAFACVICNIGCPAKHHFVGFSCVPDDDDEDY